MRTVKQVGILIVLFLTLSNCEEEKVTSREYPRLKTLSVTNITEFGATFSAEFTFRGDFEIKSYGFTWSRFDGPTIETSDKVVVNENLSKPGFSIEVKSALEEGVTYRVRPFVTTVDYTVYGSTTEFVSLGSNAPEIEEIYPSNIHYLDTITVKGQNFSFDINNNIANFDDSRAVVVSSSDTLLRVIVPESIQSTTPSFNVSVAGNIAVSDVALSFIPPQITSLSKLEVVQGDTIEIRGKYFGYRAALNTIKVDNVTVPALETDSTRIKLALPVTEKNFTISITNSIGQEVISAPLTTLDPVLTQITPDEGFYGDEIEIIGANFGNIEGIVEVYFNDQKATIDEFSNEAIVTSLPEGINNPIVTKVIVNEVEASSPDFYYLGPEITSLEPGNATWGEVITIVGNNLPETPEGVSVKIGNIEAEVISSNAEEVKIKIPTELVEETSDIILVANEIEVRLENSFTLNTPEILSLSKTSGTWNDEITITTNGFLLSPPSENLITINGINCAIINGSETSLTIRIPESLDIQSAPLKLQAYNHTTFSSNFTLMNSTINSTSIQEVTFGDDVTIVGEHFHPNNNKVYLNNTLMEIVSQSPSEIIIKIDDDFSTNKTGLDLQINSNNIVSNYNSVLSLKTPEFNSISPSHVTSLDSEITIQGNNFSPSLTNNKVNFNGSNLTITSASATELKGTLNSSHVETEFLTEYVEGSVSLSSGGINAMLAQNLVLDYKTAWTLSTETDDLFMENTSFRIDDNMYIIDFYGEFYKYDMVADSWTKLGTFPGGQAANRLAFSMNSKGYVGLGIITDGSRNSRNEMWSYDPVSNLWERLGDAPIYGIQTFYFLEGNKVVIGGGYPTGLSNQEYPFWEISEKVFEYEPSNDAWSEIGSIPYNNLNFFYITYSENVNKNLLLRAYNGAIDIQEYDYSSNSWSLEHSFSSNFVMSGGIIFDDILYFNVRNATPRLYQYDIINKTISDEGMPDLRASQHYLTRFEYNGKLYFGYYKKFLIYDPNFTP